MHDKSLFLIPRRIQIQAGLPVSSLGLSTVFSIPVCTSGAVVGSGAPPMGPRFVTGLGFMRKNPWILIYATWHSRHGSAKAGMRRSPGSS